VQDNTHTRTHARRVQVIAHELEFISKQAQGQQKKGLARQRRYEELLQAANAYVKNTQARFVCVCKCMCLLCVCAAHCLQGVLWVWLAARWSC
jgi:hypothetical protein